MKKAIKIFVLLICAFLCAYKVKAEDINYTEGTIISDSSVCTGTNCIYANNANMIIIQARLNYLNISNFENVGKTYYFVNTNAYNYLKNYNLNLIEVTNFNNYSGDNRYIDAINYINTYLNNETNGKDMLNKLTGFNDYTSVLIKDIETTPGSTKGYRILLEPTLVVSNVNNKTNTAIFTIKGIASKDTTILSTKLGTYYNQAIKVFDGNVADSNASLFNGTEATCRTYNNQTLADYKVKCLYKMYNVDTYISKDGNYTCYKKTIDVSNGGMTCTNWDKNNEETYTEKYTSYLCKTTISERKLNNIYGKKIIEETGTCKLYCKEKLELSFPGNISIPEQKGTYFAWPTTTDGSYYKLIVKTTLDCTIVDDGGSKTSSATMSRNCGAGTYNHPTNPDKCISNQTYSKVCPSNTRENNGVCYNLSNPTGNTKNYVSKSTECPGGYSPTGQTGNTACVKTVYSSKNICPGTQYVSANNFILDNGTCIAGTSVLCSGGYTQDPTTGNCIMEVSKSCNNQSERNGKCYDVSAALTTKWVSVPDCEVQVDNLCHSTPTTVPDCSSCGGTYNGTYCIKNRPNKKQCSSLGNGWTAYGSSQCKHTAGSKRDCKSPWSHYKGGGNITIECVKLPSYTSVQRTVSPYCNSGTLHGSECWSNENSKQCINSYEISNRCYVFKTSTECPTGYAYQSGRCYAYTNPACGGDYSPTGQSGNYACSKKVYSAKICTGTGYNKYSETECRKTVTPYCENGSEVVNGKCCIGNTVVDKVNNSQTGKCRSTTQTQNKICPYTDSGKQYYTPDSTSTSVCRLISDKNNVTYTCPEGFTINGTTCTNDCTSEVKEKFKTRIEEKLNNPGFSAYLKVDDSNRKINDKLETYDVKTTLVDSKRQDGQLQSFKLESTYNVKMNGNINRFYNKLTSEVSDINITGYFDRGEGVISLNRKSKTFGLNNTINNYRLEINNFKNIGIDTTFDDLLNSSGYVCQYRITDKSNCKCPIGTKNEGDSIYNISAYINEKNPKVEASNADVTYSCVELQEKYCNYEIEQEYCKKDNGEKVNITDCIKNKNATYEEAYKICEKENCNPSNNYCTKNCTYIDKKINNTVYTIQKCNDNTEICGFYLHCIDDKETSQSYLDLVSQRLNTTNIVKSLRDGLNIDNVESAIRGLDSNICGIRNNSKIVYREIDLNNPFPGKQGTNRDAGYNWKSDTIINEKITNNRGVTTNQVYNKEPIYTITLTPQIIKKIREYNENNGYNTLLKCNGSVCISDFIHGNDDSLKTMGVLTGINNCTTLNASSSLSSFDSCYNIDN